MENPRQESIRTRTAFWIGDSMDTVSHVFESNGQQFVSVTTSSPWAKRDRDYISTEVEIVGRPVDVLKVLEDMLDQVKRHSAKFWESQDDVEHAVITPDSAEDSPFAPLEEKKAEIAA